MPPAANAQTEDRAPHRPIRYLERISSYYQGLGYGAPYRWAHFRDVPFSPLAKPLTRARIALVTTAARYDSALGNQGPGAPYNAAAKFYTVYVAPADETADVRISHVAYDRDHTTAADPRTWFPLEALRALGATGQIGSVSPRFYGVPTNRSQSTTMRQDTHAVLDVVRADGADAAVLVANCPVCHQSLSLMARHLEQAGIATVLLGCAKDIVEHVGVPRFLFSDFPLGNAAGRPHDPASQALTVELALKLLAGAPAARTTVQSPLRWAEDDRWKRDYSNIALLSTDEITRRRAAFDEGKRLAAAKRATGS